MPDAPDPLGPLVGNLWVPVWAVRPGSYLALRDVTEAVPLWLALHSRNADYWKPAYASRETLGATLGISRATVSRRLKALRKASLLFEVERGMDRATRQHRPPARWALDPFTSDKWRPKVEQSLERVRQEDPQDGRWLHRAVTSLDAFERRSRALRSRIEADMPDRLVERQRKKEARRRKKARRKAAESRPRLNMSPGINLSHEGMGFTREGAAKPTQNGKQEKKSPAAEGPRASHPPPEAERAKNTADDSTVGPTREAPEGHAPQGVSGSRG